MAGCAGALGQAWFGLLLTLALLVAALLCKAMMLAQLCTSLRDCTRERWAIAITQAAFRFVLLGCPWVRVQAEGEAHWGRLGASDERPVFLLANHTSFLDTVLAVAKIPRHIAIRTRMYTSQHLLGLPLLGTCIKAMGHFPVPYVHSEEGKFAVDAEAMQQTEASVDAHLAAGGDAILSFFPEGQLNKRPAQLLPFRYGGIRRALEHDARIWHLTTCGCEVVWPRWAAVGGIPGTVRFGLEAVAPDGCQALAQQLLQAGEKSGQKEHELLATHLQATMQAHYDRLRQADGGGCFCGCCRRQSGPPASGSLESLLSPPNSPPGSPVS